jgi:glycyl-tRNA synthetase beta subunit
LATTHGKRLVDEATRQAIVEDYQSGKRVLDIEQEHGVSRATLYWVLDQAGVVASRSKRGERLRGNTEQLAMLYDVITRQENYIDELEALVRSLGGSPPREQEGGL